MKGDSLNRLEKSPVPFDLAGRLRALDAASRFEIRGKVREVVGLSIRASVPGVRLGEAVTIERRKNGTLLAEVVGFTDEEAMLLPLDDPSGVGANDAVIPVGGPLEIMCGPGLLGRVVDGLGNPIDECGPIKDARPWSIMRRPPGPMSRPRIADVLTLGIRAVDTLLTVGQGQRVGIFAGSGVGKSSLLGQIARQSATDVFVLCLVGERGREVLEFIEDSLGEEGLRRGVVVCATSDTPPLIRLKSAWVATAIAEWFRDQGLRVTLLMDSVTRFARAAREVGLAAGEPPVRRGFPPSVFTALPALVERTGQAPKGSITAFYSILVEGSDMDEPIADEMRGLLDGHIVLDRELAARGRFPAIDPLRSLSRLMDHLVGTDHIEAARKLREHLSVFEAKRDLVLMGAYRPGSEPRLDAALARIDEIEAFLSQDRFANCAWKDACQDLQRLI